MLFKRPFSPFDLLLNKHCSPVRPASRIVLTQLLWEGEASSAWDVKNYLTVKCFWLSVALSQASGRTIEMKDSPLTGAIHLRRGEIFPMCFGSDFVSHRRFSFSTVFRSIEQGRRDGGQFLDSLCFSRGEDRSKNQRLCFQWRGRLFEVESSHFVFLVLWYLPRASRRKRIGDLISSLLTLAPSVVEKEKLS